jgi:hypothetical protein
MMCAPLVARVVPTLQSDPDTQTLLVVSDISYSSRKKELNVELISFDMIKWIYFGYSIRVRTSALPKDNVGSFLDA